MAQPPWPTYVAHMSICAIVALAIGVVVGSTSVGIGAAVQNKQQREACFYRAVKAGTPERKAQEICRGVRSGERTTPSQDQFDWD